MSVSDQFEQLIAEGKINFREAPLDALTPWGRGLVETFLKPAGIKWELGDVRIGRAYCLKLHDPWLQYLDVLEDTAQFMWCTDDHHDSVHPDEACGYLITKTMPGVTVECIRDERTGLRRMILRRADGSSVTVDDLRDLK